MSGHGKRVMALSSWNTTVALSDCQTDSFISKTCCFELYKPSRLWWTKFFAWEQNNCLLKSSGLHIQQTIPFFVPLNGFFNLQSDLPICTGSKQYFVLFVALNLRSTTPSMCSTKRKKAYGVVIWIHYEAIRYIVDITANYSNREMCRSIFKVSIIRPFFAISSSTSLVWHYSTADI